MDIETLTMEKKNDKVSHETLASASLSAGLGI
jgi:hypothetical protein